MPFTKENARSILSKVPGIDPQGELSFRYLADGITNESYWLKLEDQELVLRINNPDSHRLGLDRDIEATIMKDLVTQTLSPELIYHDIEQGFQLCTWLSGNNWTKASLEQTINLNRLAQRLKQLHQLPCNHLPAMDFPKRIDLYRQNIFRRHGLLPSVEPRLLSLILKVLSTIHHALPRVLCHNDLVAANIIETQDKRQICFLDWEYAAVSDPLFELAVICNGNQLTEAAQQYLLHAYFGVNTEQYNQAFKSWCWFYDCLSLYWGLVILPEDIALPDSLLQDFENQLQLSPLI